MDSNSGLPPEILVLCTTTETKEQAAKLLDWIRHIPDVRGELASEPAIPAICSLIASEQLGNTVVTERRAQQWSQSTPEHFRAVMSEVQKLLISSRMNHQLQKRRLTLQALVSEFCADRDALSRVMMVEKAFGEANGKERWHLESDLVQLSLFVWSCRQFKIGTLKPVEEIQQCHDLPAASFNDIQKFLDEHCRSTFFQANASPLHITILNASQERSRSPAVLSPSALTETATTFEGTSYGGNSVRLEDLAREFGVADDVMGGMRYLDKMVRENEDFKDLVNWSSTMGRCVIFYWTCSLLKIPGAKHITLRNRFQLGKKEFDKILSALDLQRGELRKKLEAFHAGHPALRLLPHSTQWATTSSIAKPQYVPPAPDLIIEKSASPARKISRTGSGRRGRPPKARSPPPVSLDPISKQENGLLSLCGGPTFRRALLLLRSFHSKRLPASDADRIPPESLPAIMALVASRQLGDGQISERQAVQASRLLVDDFTASLATVRALIDVFESARRFASQTTFDDLALEHGLGIDSVVSMMHVREALKESRCLSTGMDWESPLVKCSVFFWTCAILKVPDVKQTLLRSRSLVSKREFDSMLQLLNSHCSVVRHQLEDASAAGAIVFAPPPYRSQRSITRRDPSFYGEQEISPEARDGDPARRSKRETITPSDIGSEPLGNQQSYTYVPSKKRGRPAGYRKPQPLPLDVGSDSGTGLCPVQDAVYIPTVQFPPQDWKPPESLSLTMDRGFISSSDCPSSETGDSKRRHTRYSTKDYQDKLYDRIEIWKPEGEEITEQQALYRQWEENMARHYGPYWERNIAHEKPGIPFE